ncbi:MAG TPA: helix-turn-helix domain-containing protein [Candidatus Coprocola pullicola]|nr:helix-turn-helix domain-containing protein [Candidatus Coprocola pullicola]
MKEKTKWNDYDALPLILDVTDIQHIMGISRASAYELVHTPGFPAVRSGRLIKVSKRAFFDWLGNSGSQNENRKERTA